MAKGNMLQGMARGKVGDVVFSRLNGQQVSRVRNRYPNNPKTNAQLYQRAIMATVMQAYSAGQIIFDHSFQGQEVGAANQRRFIKLNAKLLRSQIATDLANVAAGGNVNHQYGHVVYPGSITPVPNNYQISEGTLKANFICEHYYENGVDWGVGKLPAKLANETVAAYCLRNGIEPGDFYTICSFDAKSDSPYEPEFVVNGVDSGLAKAYPCTFKYCRLKVKDDVLSNTDAVSMARQILEIDSQYNCEFGFVMDDIGTVDKKAILGDWLSNGSSNTVSVIRSKPNEGLRSTAFMMYASGDRWRGYTPWGIASNYALQAWKQGSVSVGDSDLILEGGDV